METIIDYGSSISFLGEGESIVLAAFPYSWDKVWDVAPVPLRHLTIRVRAEDLRAREESRFDDEELRRRVTVIETAK